MFVLRQSGVVGSRKVRTGRLCWFLRRSCQGGIFGPYGRGPQRNTGVQWTLAWGHAYDDAGVQRSALPICRFCLTWFGFRLERACDVAWVCTSRSRLGWVASCSTFVDQSLTGNDPDCSTLAQTPKPTPIQVNCHCNRPLIEREGKERARREEQPHNMPSSKDRYRRRPHNASSSSCRPSQRWLPHRRRCSVDDVPGGRRQEDYQKAWQLQAMGSSIFGR